MSPNRSKTGQSLLDVIARAIDAHDVDALTAAFAADVESCQPVHPGRQFRGAGKIGQNWSSLFDAVPDLRARLERSATDGSTVWAEWEWSGTRRDGQPHLLRGVTILGEHAGRAAWVRLYMEPVTATDEGISHAIETLTGTVGAPR